MNLGWIFDVAGYGLCSELFSDDQYFDDFQWWSISELPVLKIPAHKCVYNIVEGWHRPFQELFEILSQFQAKHHWMTFDETQVSVSNSNA